MRALGAAPRDRSRIRQWLSSILRNFVRQHARSEKARIARETSVTDPRPSADSAADLVERVSIQQKVVAIVLDLDEAHRTVLLLRFFEYLPQREIAARLGVPVATVNSRLFRAMQKIRSEMDREFDGDRRAWLSVFLPGLQPSFATVMTAMGIFVMQTKLTVAAAALLMTGLIYLCWPNPDAVQAEPVLEGPKVTAKITAPNPEAGEERAGIERRKLAAGGAARDRDQKSEEPQVVARGIVLLPDGRPAAGVAVGFAERDRREPPGRKDRSEGVVRSHLDGRFEIPISSGRTRLVAMDPHYVTVLSGSASSNALFETVLVVGRRMQLGGQVVSTAGQAIENAKIEVRLPEDFEARLPHVLDLSGRIVWQATSGRDGRFTIEGVPAVEGLVLTAVRAPYRSQKKALATYDDRRIYMVLGEVDAKDGPAILGRVVDEDGLAVPDASIASGLTMTVSDANGNFRVLCKRAGNGRSIRAIKPGYAVARFTPDAVVGGESREIEWPDFVELRLSRSTLTIRGRILDTAGEPICGALVWTPDAETFGIYGAAPVSSEYLSAGGRLPRRAELPTEVADNPLKGDKQIGGMWRAKQPSASWFFTRSDEDGRFVLPGLADRKYRVRAMLAETLLMATSVATQAGNSDLEIRMAKEDVHELVAGTMVSSDGSPAPGVSISVFCNVRNADVRIPGGQFHGEFIRHGRRTKTDRDGRFRLLGTPAQGVRLSIYGDNIIPRFFRLKDDQDLTELRIVVRGRHHLEVILTDEDSADSIRGEDARGKRALFSVIRSGSMTQRPVIQLRRGRSGVLVAPAKLRTVVFLKDGKEAGRQAVKLVFGEKCVVRF